MSVRSITSNLSDACVVSIHHWFHNTVHLMSCIRPDCNEALDKPFYTHICMDDKRAPGTETKGSSTPLPYLCHCFMLPENAYSNGISHFRNHLGHSEEGAYLQFLWESYTGRTREKDNDVTFLATFLCYKPFLNPQTDTPHLTCRAKTLPHKHDFYIQETCLEFH